MASYHKYIIAEILAKNEFNITEVTNLEDVADILFDKNQYPSICLLIKEKNWDTIKSLTIQADGFREYLFIYSFNDQNQKQYAATAFDSDELWQDPELIDIFPLD